ncbi:hypothetical protein PENFLA_c120G04733 [Penicillium flavigenum]|uniref:Uncharacterized protein n=1 Tax=Penicillium flavigenum TaxID=254877 RepID=A0A1V6S5I9_9EURO|nr:hypothetical protein PENFLA_c120G04733 [Penicillium flavigenum]
MATEEENELFEIIFSYSERHASETQSSTSEPSDNDISETSGDCAFVVSDGDQLCNLNSSSGSFNDIQHTHHMRDDDSSDLY